jgi:hypothetical protein
MLLLRVDVDINAGFGRTDVHRVLLIFAVNAVFIAIVVFPAPRAWENATGGR